MICPQCKNSLCLDEISTNTSTWYYCKYVNCIFSKGNDQFIAISANLQDFILPLHKNLIALGNGKKNNIIIRDVYLSFFKNTDLIIPYLVPDTSDFNNTINKIKSLLIFT